MKKYQTILTFAAVCCIGIATSCSSNLSKDEAQKVAKMDSIKDSLQLTAEAVNNNIESVQKALKKVDEQFAKN
jgi:hypothetical protein